MQKLDPRTDGSTPDIVAENVEKLRELFPDAFTEGSDGDGPRWKVDFAALREILGDRVEDKQERYSFSWNGKAAARRIAQTPSTGTLRPCPDESVNWDATRNIFIEGENLEVLKLLQKSYHRKVKMIYIDPPYNTGKEFIYPDRFQDSIGTYLQYTGQTDEEGLKLSANAETSGRYHTNWLNMMLPRLKLARNLLADDGVIFVSIDDNELCNLRKVCDEVFGEECFIGQITVLCNPKGRSHDKYLATCHEYLLVYSKSILPKGALDAPKSPDEIAADFPLRDDRGVYRELELRNTHREFGRHNRPNLYYPFYVLADGTVSLSPTEGATAVTPEWNDGFAGCWSWGQKKAREQIADLLAKRVDGDWKIYRKAYAAEPGATPMKQLKSIWAQKKHHTEKGQASFNNLFDAKEKLFQSPKSVDVLMDALSMTQDKAGLVFDFFAGSCTLANAVLQSNADRTTAFKFIMVQLPEPCDDGTAALEAGYKTIADIGKERIRRAIKKIEAERAEQASDAEGQLPGTAGELPDLDLGFKVFKLDTSNIRPWDADFDNLDDALLKAVENVKPDRGEADVLYELLLKYGLDLAVPIEEREIAGRAVYVIGAGALIVCLADAIGLETVEGIAALKAELDPEIMRVVFKDAGFADDVVKTNAVQILHQAGIEDVKSL